jgi:ATP-binding cassette subfamily B protein
VAGGIGGDNLTIKAGEKLGIVGASGAGKSTLVALLRLYDPGNGDVD